MYRIYNDAINVPTSSVTVMYYTNNITDVWTDVGINITNVSGP